ncbi:MAG: hypothetical protein ACREYC_24985 [Gammaproteobacteria bacterium]
MTRQSSLLFDDPADEGLKQDYLGLMHLPGVLTPEEQVNAEIDKMPWQDDLKRRVQHYDYKARAVNHSMYVGRLPPFSIEIVQQLMSHGLISGFPDQLWLRMTGATYTAFDGYEILPKLIETEDFVSFSISTLKGAAAQNKGMPLFPRRIDGKDVMLSRKDREAPTSRPRTTCGSGTTSPRSTSHPSHGNSCRSVTAARPSRPAPGGSCSRTAWGR